MDNKLIKKTKMIFDKNKGYTTTSLLIQSGLNTRKIKYLLDSQKIIKVKRGIYKWATYEPDSFEEMIELSKQIPKGVFCLFTALSYYNLSTYNDFEFNIAIHRDSRKPKILEYPPVKFFYYSEYQFKLGITIINIYGHKIKIYDKEKTICDCIRFRHKIGFDIVKEALKEYLKQQDRDISKLIKYSNSLRISTIIKPFLEVSV